MIQDLIFVLKIPMGTTKNFFEIDTQLGNARSKRFASPGLVNGLDVRGIVG